MNSIETYTGKFFNFVNPRPEQVCIEDIAHALSYVARFGGHTDRFYSVAEHVVLVMDLATRLTNDPHVIRAALHHDDHEAYVGDRPTPLKQLLGPDYERMERRIDEAIAAHFRIHPAYFRHPLVKIADETALLLEARSLKRSGGFDDHWSFSQDAESLARASGLSVPDEGYPRAAERAFREAHTASLPLMPV